MRRRMVNIAGALKIICGGANRGSRVCDQARRLAIATMVYYIWLARNKGVFEDTFMDVGFTIATIKTHVYRELVSLYPNVLTDDLGIA